MTKFTTLVPIFAILAACGPAEIRNVEKSPHQTGEITVKTISGNDFEAGQRYAAELINKQLPIQVDSITTLKNVLYLKNTLIYNYILNLNHEDINKEEFREKIVSQLKNNVCNSEDMKKIIVKGGDFKYIYVSKDGWEIATVLIGIKDCSFN